MMDFDFTEFPVLTTKRLHLKEANSNDAKTVFILRSNKEINKFVGTKLVEKIEEAIDFIQTCAKLYKQKKRIFWLIHFQKEVIGSIVLHKISLANNYAEIGYKLKPEFQNKGFMSEAMDCIITFAKHHLKVKVLEAYTHKNNKASIALLKKHNFVFQTDRKCEIYDFNRIWKYEV